MKAGLSLDAIERLLPAPARTRLVRVGRHWVKLEREQPSGSAKYRMVRHKIRVAAAAGQLTGDRALTEVTSGSTGVALAMIGSKLRMPVVLHVTDRTPPEKLRIMSDFGATLVVHPSKASIAQLLDEVATQVAAGRAWHLNQYDRASTLAAYEALGHELVGQLKATGDDFPELFACPVGTGGLIQGVGTVLRREFPEIEIVSIEPVSKTSIDGMRNTELHHLGQRDPYDRDFPDHRVEVTPVIQPRIVQEDPIGESSTASLALVEGTFSRASLLIAPD